MGRKRAKRRLLSREAKLRARGLLDMLYKPSELARGLGIEKRDIYRKLIPAGLPHTQGERGTIWLHGPAVVAWIRTLKKHKGSKLAQNEADCLRCRKAVPLITPKRVNTGPMMVLQSICPQCGATVNRGVKK